MVETGAETFSLLGNETRLRIIEALGDLSARGEFSTVSFSALREAVGVEDSGTFSYHLRKLTDRFVLSVADGYRLSLQGINVYRGLRAGIFEADGDGPVDDVAGSRAATDQPCTDCGTPLVVWLADGRLHLGCDECDDVDMRYPVPAGGLVRAARAIRADDGPAAYAVLRERAVVDYLSMLGGFCPYCSGETRVDLTTDDGSLPAPKDVRLGVVATLTCDYCHWYLHGNLEMCLFHHPMVVPFLQRRDVDPYATDVERHVELDATVHSQSPWRLEASVAVDGDRLVLELDESLTAVDSRVEAVASDGSG
jgi:DNA-binding transcriptional ArsR family regulator